MNDIRRLLQFVRPYYSILALSLILLVFAGLFEVLTTALAIPLFDKVLVSETSKAPVGSPGFTPSGAPGAKSAAKAETILGATVPQADRVDRLIAYLDVLPGSIITRLSLALLALTLLKGLCIYLSNFMMSRVGQSVVMDLRNVLFSHVMNQSMAFFSQNSTGQLMSRMNSDVEQVQEAVSSTIAELFREVVLLISLVLWIVYLDWKLAAMSMLIAPAALTMTLTMGKRIRRASLRSRENIATLSDMLQQTISGIRIVKAFGMERKELERFAKAAMQLFRVNLKAARILFINSPLMEVLGVVSFIPLLYYAHARIAAKTLTLGKFGGSLFSLFRMYDPIRKLSRIHVQFQRAFASTSRITALLDTHVEIQDRPGAMDLEGVRSSVEFRNLCFSYSGEAGSDMVLSDVNLSVEKCKVIALVGSSGSGKSTLVSMIPRFYDATSGSVLIDRVDVRDYSQASLRRNIALVTQETFLFNDSIRNNIAYGSANASMETIVAAAQAALAHDFIQLLPAGYDTLVGERGQRLSGGERQRIAIARAVLKNAPILILDEATSALDSESEKLVQRALANLMKDRTTFVIAHRLSTIRNADLIVVLEQGRVAEAGTHDSLVEANGLYHKFYRLQTHDLLTQN